MCKETPRNSVKPSVVRNTKVRVFSSFEEENAAEHRRLAGMSHQERMREFAVLQARRWGDSWGLVPMEKRVSWERLSWQG